MKHPVQRAALLAILLFSLLALAGDGPGFLLAQGDAHFAAGEYSRALVYYQQAANHDPADPSIDLRLGQLHLVKGRFVQAEAFLTRAADRGASAASRSPLCALLPLPACTSNQGKVYLVLGDVYSRTARPALAAAAYRLALDLGAEGATYRLALAWIAADRRDLAQTCLAGLVAQGHQGASLRLGLLLALDDPPSAAYVLDVAARGPDPALAAAARGVVDDLRPLTLHPPTTGPAGTAESTSGAASSALLVGRAALRQDLPGVARVAFAEAVRRQPDDAQAKGYLGLALYLLKEYDPALGALGEAQRLDPTDARPHHIRGLIYRLQGLPEQALTELEAALAADPGNPALLSDLGETYAAQRNYPQAHEDLTAAAYADAQSPVPWLRLARFHLDYLYQVEDGLAAAQQAVRLAPTSGDALDVLGWALYLNQQPSEALAALRRAVEAAPASAGAQYHLAAVAANLGDTEMARRAYRRAMDLDTSGAYEARAQRALAQLDPPRSSR